MVATRTSIQVSPAFRRRLESLKLHPRETYEEVIARALPAPSTVTARPIPARIERPPPTLASVAPAVAAFKQRLASLYGGRLVKVVLFGSVARGEARAGSDVDLLIVLAGDVQPGAEIDRMIDVLMETEDRTGVPISAIPISETRFLTEVSPLLLNVRKEGVPV